MKTKIILNDYTLQSPSEVQSSLPEILFINSYPPRVCGIATYSHDLVKALNDKFDRPFSIKVCALESEYEKHQYAQEVDYTLDTSISQEYIWVASAINHNVGLKMVLIQYF